MTTFEEFQTAATKVPEMTTQEEQRLLRSLNEAMCDIAAGKGVAMDEFRKRVGSWAAK